MLRHRSSLRLSQQAHERWQRDLREAGHSAGTAYAMLVGGGPPQEPPDEHETVARFWSEPPDRLREETETLSPQRHEHVTVRDGKRWWTYAPEWGAVSNVADEDGEEMSAGGGELWAPMLDPSVWIPALDFELIGDASSRHRARRSAGRTPAYTSR